MKVQPHHHHAGDPEEDDVEAGDEDARRIIAFQFRRLVGPAERRERPQRRGEPSVEHVLVARQGHIALVFFTRRFEGFRLAFPDEDIAILVVPRRYPMAPPQLPRNTPGLDILQPLEIGLLPILRHEIGAAVAHGGQRRLGQRLGVDIPLVGEARLQHRVRAVAMRHGMDIVGDFGEQSALVHHRHDARARLETVEPVERLDRRVEFAGRGEAFEKLFVPAQRHARFGVEHIDQPQPMPLADLEVVEVMRRGDLHRAGALFGVGIFVGDDGNEPPDQRQADIAPDKFGVALVFRMHGDRRVAEHRLGPRRRDGDELAAVLPVERDDRDSGSATDGPSLPSAKLRDRRSRCAARGPN